MSKLVSFLVIFSLIQCGIGDVNDNEVGDDAVNEDKGQDLASMVVNFMKSDGAKHLGSIMFGEQGGAIAGDIMKGVGNMMSHDGHQKGIDMGMVTNIISLINTQQNAAKDGGGKKAGFDFSSVVALANSFIQQQGSNEMLDYLPPILELLSSFYGPDADRIDHDHAGHAWFLPPIVERMHVLFDIFMNSKFGNKMALKFGGEKFIKIFSDKETGKFSYTKFIDMLENHSFRKHWLNMVTVRTAELVSYAADPYTQQKYINTAQFFVNNLLRTQGVPESMLFDPTRATESIVGIFNFFTLRLLNMKIDTTFYVQPAVEYVQEILRLAEHKGILGRAVDSNELMHKLTDTINLEIIEPIARVNRALRFATKEPSCTQYVLCVANEIGKAEKLSLPGLKKSLSQAFTLGASWYLSGHEHMDFWTLYEAVSKGVNCKFYYTDKCHGFHIEEQRAASTEYVHPEL